MDFLKSRDSKTLRLYPKVKGGENGYPKSDARHLALALLPDTFAALSNK